MPGNEKKIKKQYIMCDLDQCEKVKELETQLAEAQQWIDSEPDWKGQYIKRYMALQSRVKELEKEDALAKELKKASELGVSKAVELHLNVLRQAWDYRERVEKLGAKLRSICPHKNTHNEDWPDGGGIIVCDDCGMSKYVWEQGEGSWQWIEDIPQARKELEEGLEEIRKNIKFEEGGRVGTDSESGCIDKWKGEKV